MLWGLFREGKGSVWGGKASKGVFFSPWVLFLDSNLNFLTVKNPFFFPNLVLDFLKMRGRKFLKKKPFRGTETIFQIGEKNFWPPFFPFFFHFLILFFKGFLLIFLIDIKKTSWAPFLKNTGVGGVRNPTKRFAFFFFLHSGIKVFPGEKGLVFGGVLGDYFLFMKEGLKKKGRAPLGLG